jgi:acid phosphatase (class A)
MMRFLALLMMAGLLVPEPARGANFVAPDQIDVKSLLQPPPAEDSPQEKKEIEKIISLQANRSDDDVKRIKYEANLTPFICGDILGKSFNAADLPVTARLLNEIAADTGAITSHAKHVFNRKRPPLVDARVSPCLSTDGSSSYPSGHSTYATVFGRVLARLSPENTDKLLARSRQIGDDRVLAGVHFPSDVEAGRVLGNAIADHLFASPDFLWQLQSAEIECEGRLAK